LNTSTGILVLSRSSIIAHTLEKPLTGGGSGPTNATLRVIRDPPRQANVGVSLPAYSSGRATALQDTIVGRAPILPPTRRRSPNLADSIAEAKQKAKNAALANPSAIISEPRIMIIKNTDA
jgi:hypothetical protein